jgi:hypothetical protein
LFLALRQLCFDPGNVPPQETQPAWLFQLATLLLQPEVKPFLTQVPPFSQQFVTAQLCDFLHFHDAKRP